MLEEKREQTMDENKGQSHTCLRFMKKNQSGTVSAVNASGDMGRRIREMGMVPGVRITVQGRAPLYDPVALRIYGCTISLRNNEADYIDVAVEP